MELTNFLKSVIKYGVVIFIIAYPIYKFKDQLKKAGLWIRKNYLKRGNNHNKKEVNNNGNIK